MAKSKTVKTRDPKPAPEEGAGDKVEKIEKVQNAKDLPTQADSPRVRRDKAQAIFDKADEAGKADIIEATKRSQAALGGF